MAENYGVYGELVTSLASSSVSTDTTLIFVGTAKGGSAGTNKVVECSSYSDYEAKFGADTDDQCSLTDGAIAAFNIAGISSAYFVRAVEGSDYVAAKEAIVDFLSEKQSVTNIICAPKLFATALGTVAEACSKADGHWDSVIFYDNQSNMSGNYSNGAFSYDAVNVIKSLSDEKAICNLGYGKYGDLWISMAAIRASLQAKSDAEYGAPVRSGGNLYIPKITAWGDAENGAYIVRETEATKASTDGICMAVNYGGSFYTWGDHTAAFNKGTVADERARFDNSIRLMLMITNRFQAKYRASIDRPLTLQMRNDIINEELQYLFTLKSKGALVGTPTVEFRATSNTSDSLQAGEFIWNMEVTTARPMKYAKLQVAYTSAGLSEYLVED